MLMDVSINRLLGDNVTDYLFGDTFNLCVYRGVRQELKNQGVLSKDIYQLMRDIAAHPVQNASTNHKYVTPYGNTITNLAVYH